MSDIDENKVGEKLAPFNPTCDEVYIFCFYCVGYRISIKNCKFTTK